MSGAETVIHALQQTLIQSPNFDSISADAIKAFYNLNRDLALKKLKEKCPVVFDMISDKYNGSSNIFFNGLVEGVIKMEQVEGGSPGTPEMSFLYELGISDFVSNVADLLRHTSSGNFNQEGSIVGYIDDLYWAAPFEKMVQVIALVQDNGADFGYRLNLKKSLHLMAPSPNA